jgi:hypothetical protein
MKSKAKKFIFFFRILTSATVNAVTFYRRRFCIRRRSEMFGGKYLSHGI